VPQSGPGHPGHSVKGVWVSKQISKGTSAHHSCLVLVGVKTIKMGLALATPEILICGGGYSPGGLGTEVPQWSLGAKPRYGPVGVLRRPKSWNSLQTLFTDFDWCRNYQFWKLCTIFLLMCDQYVSRWGGVLSDFLGASSASWRTGVDPWVDRGTFPPYFLKWRGRPVLPP